jgi:CubicO group peptidase (beta-lactamase class C family)
MRKILILTIICLSAICNNAKAQALYFPPLSSTASWDTISPSALGWCMNEIDTLYDYLQAQDTKGFIVLKDGKIVLEKYFGTFTKDSLWVWNSAGKTITSFLTGKAQEENYLSIQDPSSTYLGTGWTNCTALQESNIKIRNQLTMTSGLDDGVPDNNCTIDTCLKYLAATGTRWAYHTAVYSKLVDVVTASTGVSYNSYTQSKLKNKIGMSGTWINSGYNKVYVSNARSMARFGLLIQNKCIWNADTLLHDTSYINQMTSSSQLLNPSYGYLWWLNGKASYMLPSSQFVFSGSFAPNAPSDMFSAVGKNGQIASISRSKGLVLIRMGNQLTNTPMPFTLIDEIWNHLNHAMCTSTSITEKTNNYKSISIYPNPANDFITINVIPDSNLKVQISNVLGELMTVDQHENKIDITNLARGIYFISVKQDQNFIMQKFIKQ